MAVASLLDSQSGALAFYGATPNPNYTPPTHNNPTGASPGYANRFYADKGYRPSVVYHIHKWETPEPTPPTPVPVVSPEAARRQKIMKIVGLVLKIFGVFLLLGSIGLSFAPGLGALASPTVATIGGLVLFTGYKMSGEDLKPALSFKAMFGALSIS